MMGTAISGLHPGDTGYAAAARTRAYQLSTGGTSVNSPRYGNYAHSALGHLMPAIRCHDA
jgi:hypothetical protein